MIEDSSGTSCAVPLRLVMSVAPVRSISNSLFCYRGAAVAEAFAVALVDEELMVVDRDDVTYPRTDPARRCSR